MTGMRWRAAALVAAAWIGMPAAVAGQGRPAPGQPGHPALPRATGPSSGGRVMAGMGDPLAHLPLMLLEQREPLQLDSAQVRKLEALHAEGEEAMKSRGAGMSAVHGQLMAALESGKLNLSDYQKALRAVADSMVARRMESARRAQRALDVLTSTQRSNALYGLRLMHMYMMRGGMHRGMRPGMRGTPGRHDAQSPASSAAMRPSAAQSSSPSPRATPVR